MNRVRSFPQPSYYTEMESRMPDSPMSITRNYENGDERAPFFPPFVPTVSYQRGLGSPSAQTCSIQRMYNDD